MTAAAEHSPDALFIYDWCQEITGASPISPWEMFFNALLNCGWTCKSWSGGEVGSLHIDGSSVAFSDADLIKPHSWFIFTAPDASFEVLFCHSSNHSQGTSVFNLGASYSYFVTGNPLGYDFVAAISKLGFKPASSPTGNGLCGLDISYWVPPYAEDMHWWGCVNSYPDVGTSNTNETSTNFGEIVSPTGIRSYGTVSKPGIPYQSRRYGGSSEDPRCFAMALKSHIVLFDHPYTNSIKLGYVLGVSKTAPYWFYLSSIRDFGSPDARDLVGFFGLDWAKDDLNIINRPICIHSPMLFHTVGDNYSHPEAITTPQLWGLISSRNELYQRKISSPSCAKFAFKYVGGAHQAYQSWNSLSSVPWMDAHYLAVSPFSSPDQSFWSTPGKPQGYIGKSSMFITSNPNKDSFGILHKPSARRFFGFEDKAYISRISTQTVPYLHRFLFEPNSVFQCYDTNERLGASYSNFNSGCAPFGAIRWPRIDLANMFV